MSRPGKCQENSTLSQRRAEALKTIQAVLDTPPRQRHQIIDFGESAIVELRDCLISQLRALPETGETESRSKIRAELDHVNIALSLITGVTYPGAGIQQEALEQARDVLLGLSF